MVISGSGITDIENANTISEGVQSGLTQMASGSQETYTKDLATLQTKIKGINSYFSNLNNLSNAISAINNAIAYVSRDLNGNNAVATNNRKNTEDYVKKYVSYGENFVGKYAYGYGWNNPYPGQYWLSINQSVTATPNWVDAVNWLPAFKAVLERLDSALPRGGLQSSAGTTELQSLKDGLANVTLKGELNKQGEQAPRGGYAATLYDKVKKALEISKTVDTEKSNVSTTAQQSAIANTSLDTGKFTRERAVEALKNKTTSEGLGFGSI
jgi:uncharacterized protein YoxC